MPYRRAPVPALALKLEIFVSTALALWGLWLVMPAKTFEATPTLRLLEIIAPESVIGLIIMLFGLVGLYAIFYSYEKQRMFTLAAVALWWAIIAVLIAAGNWQSTGTAIYSTLALGSVWCLPDAYRRHRLQEVSARRKDRPVPIRIPR